MRDDQLEHSICLALSIGIVVGIPLTVFAEILPRESGLLRIITLFITAPGALYGAMTGNSTYESASVLTIYFAVQATYIAVLVFVLIMVVRFFRRRDLSQSTTPD